MSEFEKELEKFNLENGTDYRTLNQYSDVLTTHFKDWQPPKELVEVPQYVDEVIRSLSNGVRSAYDAMYLIKCKVEQYEGTGWRDVYDWIFEKGNSTVFERAFLDGYTVEKEKKYILKHIDISELYLYESLYLSHGNYTELEHEIYSDEYDMSKIKQCHFTQSEIDKLNIGSYEQIEVVE